MNIYICSCVEDKNPNIRNRYSLSNLFEPEYIKIFHKDDLYVMVLKLSISVIKRIDLISLVERVLQLAEIICFHVIQL